MKSRVVHEKGIIQENTEAGNIFFSLGEPYLFCEEEKDSEDGRAG